MCVSHGEGPWHDHTGPRQRACVGEPLERVRAKSFSPERCNDFARESRPLYFGDLGVSTGRFLPIRHNIAKARRSLATAWYVEVGGSGGYGWMGPCGPRTGDRQIFSGRGGGRGRWRLAVADFEYAVTPARPSGRRSE